MMTYFGEVVTAPTALPITVAAADQALAAAVVEEIERVHLWRAVVRQTRRITVDGPLPPRIEIEPLTAIVSLTRWTPARFPQRKARGRSGAGSEDTAEVIDPASYSLVSRDPAGALIAPAPGYDWPAPQRSLGSFTLTYECGWEVEPESAPGANDAINNVPSSVILMLTRAISFRAGGGGVGDLKIGSLDLSVPDSYSTDQLPREIASIGRSWAYRPSIISARP